MWTSQTTVFHYWLQDGLNEWWCKVCHHKEVSILAEHRIFNIHIHLAYKLCAVVESESSWGPAGLLQFHRPGCASQTAWTCCISVITGCITDCFTFCQDTTTPNRAICSFPTRHVTSDLKLPLNQKRRAFGSSDKAELAKIQRVKLEMRKCINLKTSSEQHQRSVDGDEEDHRTFETEPTTWSCFSTDLTPDLLLHHLPPHHPQHHFSLPATTHPSPSPPCCQTVLFIITSPTQYSLQWALLQCDDEPGEEAAEETTTSQDCRLRLDQASGSWSPVILNCLASWVCSRKKCRCWKTGT